MPWMLWELKLMLQMLLELEEEVVEEFHSMVLDSLEPDCLELVKFRNCRGLVVPHCWKLMAPDCWKLMVPNCRELVVPDCWELVEFRDCWELVEFQDCWELVEFQDCWELVEFQEIGAGEDPLLLVIKAGEDPQVRVALGVLGQLLSHCFRRLDAMVQVGTGRALLGRWQLQ